MCTHLNMDVQEQTYRMHTKHTNMHMYACMHTHMHTHTCVHALTHAHMHTHIQTHTHIHMHTGMYAHTLGFSVSLASGSFIS